MNKTIAQLSSFEYRPEYFSAAIELCWGLIVLNPYNSQFAKFPKVYAPMHSIVASELFWGGLYSMVALFVFAASVSDVLKLRKYATLLLALSFFSKSVLFSLGDGLNPGVTTYGLIAVFNLWSFLVFSSRNED